MSEYVTLSVDDGTTMRAYVSRPASPGRHPGILLFQEAYGVNAHIRDVADRLAGEGYVVIAPELFHRTAPGFEGEYADFESVRPLVSSLTDAGLEADIRASYQWLTRDTAVQNDILASVGFCMGGRASFLANVSTNLRAAVSFYGGNIAETLTGRIPNLSAPALLLWGGKDARIPPEQIRKIVDGFRAAGKPYTSIEFSEAGHGFFCDARQAYHRESADQAWSLVKDFLRQHTGGK